MRTYPEAFRILYDFVPAPHQKRYLSGDELNRLFSNVVTIEEKVDGSLVGVSWKHGRPFVQAKGRVLSEFEKTSEHGHGKAFHGLWKWVWANTERLERIPPGHTVFGEWLLACHSIEYDALPDLFIAFDVMDRSGSLMGPDAKAKVWERTRLSPVPILHYGRVGYEDVPSLVRRSAFSTTAMAEGVVVKNYTQQVWGKFVSQEFFDGIEENWLRQPWKANRLASGQGSSARESMPKSGS